MIKLYGTGPSRWVKPYWLLKEMAVPFETVSVSISKGENRSAQYLAINPFGKVPALADGPVTLFESSAICNYLADKYPEKALIPRAGTADRGYYDQWISFATTELEQPLWRIIKHRFVYPEEKRSAAEIELAVGDFKKLLTTFSALLADKKYLVADRFTVADIAMTYTLRWAQLPSMPAGLLEGEHKVTAYMQRHMERTAFPHDLYPQAPIS